MLKLKIRIGTDTANKQESEIGTQGLLLCTESGAKLIIGVRVWVIVGLYSSQYEANISQYAANISQYAANISQYAAKLSQYAANISQYAPNISQYAANISQYAPNISQYEVLVCSYILNVRNKQ